MSKKKFDFSGYATKYNVKCADGRTILPNAFNKNDGVKVPLVWIHTHSDPSNVLGHALLENREDGVYVYGTFNDSESGKNAKILVQHGDITALSIYANDLVEKLKNVAHGMIREVSLVMAGANPGALIDNVTISHSDGSVSELEDSVIIYSGLDFDPPSEEDEEKEKEENEEENDEGKNIQHAEEGSDGETVGDVFNTLSEKQKTAVYAIIAELQEDLTEGKEELEQSNLNEGDENTMKQNVFEGIEKSKRPTLTHDQFQTILNDAQQMGSFKQAFLKHAGTYGIDNIDFLFPDAQAVSNEPVLYSRDMAWVKMVLNGTRHSPFSRIKSMYADITVETARALGYVTGALKKEEVFALLRRITTPTTIYKKQKLDRDDIIDITDLDVVAWLKREMRLMLDEELARAVLISDGRDVASEDKISETNIRPIYLDDDMYAHHVLFASDDTVAEMEEAMIRAREFYKGSGSPVMFTTTTFLTDLLLQKDTLGRRLYATEAELAAALRVSKIVEVPVMDSVSRDITDPAPATLNLMAIVVNLSDYTLGADKGGQVSMFDDFDIDYNQFKYLLETRVSGALVLPKSALVFEQTAPAE